MAVGGMFGGGIYTLAGVILGAAGALAWVSLALGALIALATVRSYAQLTLETRNEAVPLAIVAHESSRSMAAVLAWCLLVVYILALAVYIFTVGNYFGRALELSALGIAASELVLVCVLVALNLRHLESPVHLQIATVWLGLVILGTLAAIGCYRWNPENLSAGVPASSLGGIIVATAATFIAFEGFEMLAYDLREMRRPHRVLRAQLPRAVIAVALAYAFVTVGAASLVGAGTLVQNQERSLAIAGYAAAGNAGLVVVTIAACAAGISAINVTLFSVARLARASAEQGLLPDWCARCNRHDAPHWSVVVIGSCALIVAAISALRQLVATASLGFLALFCLVNVLAFRRIPKRRWIALGGVVGSGGGAIVVLLHLAYSHPSSLFAIAGVAGVALVIHAVTRSRL